MEHSDGAVVVRAPSELALQSHVQAPTALQKLMNSGVAIGGTAIVGAVTGALLVGVMRLAAGDEPEEDPKEAMHIHGVSRRWVNSRLHKSQDMVATLKKLSEYNDKHEDVPAIIQSIAYNVAQMEHLSDKLGEPRSTLSALRKIYALQTKIQRKLTELVFVVMGTLEMGIVSNLHRSTGRLSAQVASFCELCSAVSRVTRQTRGFRPHTRRRRG